MSEEYALTLLIAYTFIAGLVGMIAQLNATANALSNESFDSGRRSIRWAYRYLIFSVNYLVSFLVTPAIVVPLAEIIGGIPGKGNGYTFFALCLPLAFLFYSLNLRIIRRFDGAKVRGRRRYR